jgi:hypothetical protein
MSDNIRASGKGDVEEKLEEGRGTGKGPCVSIRVLVCMGDQAAGLDDHNGG